MSKGDPLPPLPADAPKVGETYKHYKGDLYRVVGLALSAADEWTVVYEALYENPAAKLFTRPVSQWAQEVEWQGGRTRRFSKTL